jgi:hypothetical protein
VEKVVAKNKYSNSKALDGKSPYNVLALNFRTKKVLV